MEWIAVQCIRAFFPCLELLPMMEVCLFPRRLMLLNHIILTYGPASRLSLSIVSLLPVCLTF